MAGFAYLGPPNEESEEALLDRLFLEHHPTIAVDTETVSLKDRTLIGIGLSPNSKEAYYFEVLPEPSPYLDRVWDLLENPNILKVFHNAMYDLDVLGETYEPIADTSIMMQMQALPYKLKDAANYYAGGDIDEISDILPKRKNMLDLDFPTVAAKCLDDVLYTHRLYYQMGGDKWQGNEGHTWTYKPNWYGGWQPLEPTSCYVSPQMKDCYQVDIRLIPLLLRMGRRGLALRQDRLEDWYEKLSQERLFYQDICTQHGFSAGSNQQVGYTLAERGTVLKFTQTRGRNAYKQLKVDEEVLSQCNDPLAQVVLLYRERKYLLSHYIEPWRGEERAHTRFGLETGTGRLKSSDRNLQNIPKEPRNVRDIFEPDSEVWTWGDYNQLEMRVFAHLTQDPLMLEAYRVGADIHTSTQAALYPGSDLRDEGIRKGVKGFNFIMIFLGQPKALSKNSGIPVPTCARFREEWLDHFEVAADYMTRQQEIGLGQGWSMSDYGRKQRLPDPSMFPQHHIASCTINYPTQGTAADIVKRAMLICEDMDLVAQIHDELLVDGDEDFPEGLDHIHPEIPTPFKVRSGPVWSAKEE